MHEIEVCIEKFEQLFNPIDPAPIRKRDIAPRIEEFIVDWAKDVPRNAPFGLVLYIAEPNAEAAAASDAIHEYFRQRSRAESRRLRELFRRGKISLVIGVLFLLLALVASNLIESLQVAGGMLIVISTSLVIAGWVAMWRPMEIFLYDWWPIRAEIRLYERLATMPIRVSNERHGM